MRPSCCLCSSGRSRGSLGARAGTSSATRTRFDELGDPVDIIYPQPDVRGVLVEPHSFLGRPGPLSPTLLLRLRIGIGTPERQVPCELVGIGSPGISGSPLSFRPLERLRCGANISNGPQNVLVRQVGNEGMNPGIGPLKGTASWTVFLGVIPFLIPCLSHRLKTLTGAFPPDYLRPDRAYFCLGWFVGVGRHEAMSFICGFMGTTFLCFFVDRRKSRNRLTRPGGMAAFSANQACRQSRLVL